MAANEVHVDDIGTVFVVTLMDGDAVVDINGATTKSLKFGKPDQTSITKTAAFTTDGTDGKLQYTTLANDLDAMGQWQIQAYVVLPTGTWHSDIGEFAVYDNL